MNNQIANIQKNVELISDSTNIHEIIASSDITNITEKQMEQVVNAYNAKAYDMAGEYVWKKAMTRLKEAILSLGVDFISEILQENSNMNIDVYSALTDYRSINLAEHLGMLPHSGALELRQGLESLQYYFSSQAAKEGAYIDNLKVLSIIKTCVIYILSKPNIDVSIAFGDLRKLLLTQDIRESDIQVSQLKRASLFFIRTVCTVLISAVRNPQNVYFEHAVNNFKIVIPLLWEKLPDEDRKKVGFLYRDVVSDGNNKAAMSIKNALSKNGGFDYVPENLRSQSFIAAANAVIDAHYEYDNFYKEPRYVNELASLGSFIPDPAISQCMKAYILVCVGNYYGVSYVAAEKASKELESITKDKWKTFLDKCLPYDYELISALSSSSEKPINNFLDLLRNLGMNKLSLETSEGRYAYRAILMKNTSYFSKLAREYSNPIVM